MFPYVLPLADAVFLTPPVRRAAQTEAISLPVDQIVMFVAVAAVGGFLALLLWQAVRALRAARRKAPNWIVIDGSNVMHWKDDRPQIETVRSVVRELTARGYSPGVVFDANVGYKIANRYQDNGALANMLHLKADQVFVVPKGTQADLYLLAAARDLKARVVTNDRFRDWAAAHPEVREPGFLIRGGYRAGALWLEDVPKTARA